MRVRTQTHTHNANRGYNRCWRGWFEAVNLFVFSQITTGMLHHLQPHHPTCTLPPSRVKPALTSPSISRPAHPTASFWKTWATLTSFAWSSNVRCVWVILCVCAWESYLIVFLSHILTLYLAWFEVYPAVSLIMLRATCNTHMHPKKTQNPRDTQKALNTHIHTPTTAICLPDYGILFCVIARESNHLFKVIGVCNNYVHYESLFNQITHFQGWQNTSSNSTHFL